MKKLLCVMMVFLSFIPILAVLAPRASAATGLVGARAPASDLLSLPAEPYGSHNMLMESPLAGHLVSVSEQSIRASPGQTVSVSVTYQVFAQTSPNNPSEIDQLFFVESWTTSWPPQGYTIPLYNGIPGLSPGVTQTNTISFTAPSVSGNYYLWLCFEAQYSMQDAVNQRTQSMTGLPGHIGIIVTPALADSLVGYWKFDEGSGNIAHDSSGNGNDGIIHTATWTAGIVGGALHYNGVDSWVEVPNSPTLTGLSQITLEAWIQEDSMTTELKGIISKCDGGFPPTNAEYFLGINDNRRVLFDIDNGVSIAGGNPPTHYITEAGRWYHIAGTWSGNSYAIYVNGVQAFSGTSTPQTTLSNTLPVQIGRHGDWSWVYFNGIIDEVRIYNYARTAQEIQTDMRESVIFQDSFESYAVGTFPSTGGWQVVYNGAGDQYQVINDSYSHSQTKSLQLVGSYGWSVVVKKDFSSTTSVIGYEGYMMSVDSGINPQFGTASIGFLNQPIVQWGRYYAGVYFLNGSIWTGGSDASSVELQAFTPGTWYKIRVVLDKSLRLYNVSIDDVLVGTNLGFPHDPNEIQSLQLSESWQSTYCYFDDVEVFQYPSSFSISSVSSITATRLQTIRISGRGFGDILPQTVFLGDGSVETVKSNTTPSMAICDNGTGSHSWIAGFTDNSTVFSSIGLILVSWSDNEIVLGGFGDSLGTSGQGTWNIAAGDPLQIDVYLPGAYVTYYTFVVELSPTLFEISLYPPIVQIGVGKSGLVELTIVNPRPDFNSSIKLDVVNSPPGLTYTFDKQVLIPNDEHSIMTFTASYEATEGLHSLTIIGSSEGSTTNASLSVIVQPPSTPFALAMPPTSLVVQGGSLSVQAGITLLQNGFDFPVELAVAKLPLGVTCSFSKQTILPNETSTIIINAAQNATPGQYQVTFTEISNASSYNFMDSTIFWLSVEASPIPVWMQTWFWALLGGVAGIMLVSSVGQFYYKKWRKTRVPLDVSYLAAAGELSQLEEQRLLGNISQEEYEKSKKEYERKLRGE